MWSTLSDKWHEAPNTAEYYVRREVRIGSDSRASIIFTGPYTLSNGLVQRCNFTGTGLPGALLNQAYY